MRASVGLGLLMSLLSTSLTAQPKSPQLATNDIEIDWPVGAEVGEGWDTLGGHKAITCLESVPSPTPVPQSGTTSWTWDEVTSQQTLRKKLGLTAAASYQGGSSVSAKVEFSSENKIDQYSINWIARQTFVGNPQIIGSVALKPKMQKLLDRDPLKFREKCGTHFIRGFRDGGEYYALLNLSEFKKEYRESIKAMLSASGASFKGSVSGSSEIEKSEYASHIKVNARKAGGDAGPVATTPEQLRHDFENFRAQMADPNNRVKIVAIAVPYAGLAGNNPQAHDLDVAVNLYMDYLNLEGDLRYLGQQSDNFFVDQPSVQAILPKMRTKVENLRNNLYDQMRDCSTSLSASEIRKNCSFVSFPLPPQGNKWFPAEFSSSCTDQFVTIAPQKGFNGFVRVAGDGSMGGGDVLDFATELVSSGGNALLLSLHARAYETAGDHSRFEKAVAGFPVWTAIGSGCYLKKPISLSESFANTRVTAPVGIHDYTTLFPASAIIASVDCRTNKDREDDGYVGCSEIALKPVPAELEHVELIGSPAPPAFSWPTWLPTKIVEPYQAPAPPSLFRVTQTGRTARSGG